MYSGHTGDAVLPRLERLDVRARTLFPNQTPIVLSVPGRTELGGNHTDHNHGIVCAASVDCDMLAMAFPVPEHTITVYSEGFPKPFSISLAQLKPNKSERGRTEALIRGMAALLGEKGYPAGGFCLFLDSTIPNGSGLSSSAAFEVLVGEIINHLFHDGTISAIEIARCGQQAENLFYGKPCGLMDQIACAFDGVSVIDFNDPAVPVVESIPFPAAENGFTLCVVNTGGDHVGLTADYKAIQDEMKACARFLGKPVLRDVLYQDFCTALPVMRKHVSDRALLRAMHFFQENERVKKMAEYLSRGNFQEFLEEVKKSGLSSWRLLQNCHVAGHIEKQNTALALAMTEQFIKNDGACRVHGGGFGGTIQCYIRNDRFSGYCRLLEPVFGTGSIFPVAVRKKAVVRLL